MRRLFGNSALSGECTPSPRRFATGGVLVLGPGLEPVAHARLGDQPARPGRVRLQLAAQLGHVQPQVAGGVRVAGPPHLLEQLALAEQLARVPEQDGQQVPLGRGEPDRVRAVPGPADPFRGQVDDQVADPHLRLLSVGGDPAADRPDPGQQFVHREGLGHVVVRARVQGLHLVRAIRAAGQHDDRRAGPAAQPGDDFHAVQVGQAEVEDDHVRRVPGGLGQCLGAVRRGGHVVLPDAQVDPQRPDDLRLVVHHQDPGHPAARPVSLGAGCPACSAAARDRVMVSPPPGVSDGSSVPPIASVSPRDRASPRPTPVVLSVSPSRWNAVNTASRSRAGIPGPRSITLSSTRPPSALAVSRGGVPAGAYRSALPARLAITRSSSPGSASTSGSSSEISTVISRPASPRSSSARAVISARPAGRGNTDSAPAWSRLRSSRLSTSRVSRSSDSSAVASSSAWSSAPHRTSVERRLVTAALAEASGVRRSWLTAASSAVRIRSASAIGRAAAASAASRCCSSAVAAYAANAPRTRRSVAASGRPRSASISVGVTVTSTSASCGLVTTGLPELATGDQRGEAGGGRSAGSAGRSSSVTDSMPNDSRTRSSTAARACCPRSTLPAVVTSSSDSAVARAACLLRRAASSTTELTTSPTRTNTASAAALLASEMVNLWIGGVK